MTHSSSRTINGLLERLNRYVAMTFFIIASMGLYAQSCPAPLSITGNIPLNNDCTNPSQSIIKSGDALEIALVDCKQYTFEVCYNVSYELPEKDQVQIQLFNTSFIQEDAAGAQGCAKVSYTSGVNDIVTLQAFSHSCLADWKQWDLIITQACCEIVPSSNVNITATQADCRAPAFSISTPLVSLGCNTTLINYTIVPPLNNPPTPLFALALIETKLDIPAGNEVGTYTLTWSIPDCNGNTTSTTQIISINPLVVCNDQVNLTIPNGVLTVDANLVAEEISPNCFDDYTISIFDNGVPIGNQISCSFSGQSLDYTLTHISTGLACTGRILIEDKTGPSILCVDMDIPCSTDSAPASIGQPFVTDNCDDNPTLSSFDNFIDYDCGNNSFLGTILRTWIATDNLGNSSTCVQTINIIRPTLAGLSFPADTTINCTNADIDPSNTGGPSISALISGNACNFIIDFEDSTTPICTGTNKIIRRWTVIDWCTGEERNATQLIVVEDQTGPTLVCPETLTFGANETTCDATINFPVVAATDDCSTVISVMPNWEFGSGFGPFTNIPIGEYIVNYIAEDDCGNTSQCTVSLSVIDDVIPVAVCDLFTTVGIGESQTSQICAEDIDSGSYDNCELVNREIRLLGDENFSECISLTCAQTGMTLMIQMQVTDQNGLQNQCIVEVNVFDKTPPVITNCAADITISCDDNTEDTNLTGLPIAVDNCATNLSFTDVINVNECNIGEIIRTFIVTDNSANEASCIQTITLVDSTAPVITFSPDLTLACQGSNDEIGKPTVEDNCGVFAFSFEDEIKEDSPCIQRFVRTWEVLNICTEEIVRQALEVSLLNDTNVPEFSGAPTEITINCEDVIPDFIMPIITDICDTDLLIETSTVDAAGDCPSIRNITRTYTATDDCGNTNTFVQTIRLIDNTGPRFIDFPADQTINCDEEPSDDFPLLADNCDNNPSLTFSQDTIPGDCPDELFIFRTYTATDLCGNASSAVQLFHFIDNVPPIIRGQTDDLTLSCEFIIPVFDLGAIDNCDTQVTVDFTDTSMPGDCPNSEIITRIHRVTDDCGNVTLDTTLITTIDNTAPSVTATNLVENLTIACNQAFPIINFTILDNCDEDVLIMESRDTTGDPCNLNVIRIFTATDDCGNATTLEQNLIIVDDQAPIFSAFPQDQDVTIFNGESVQVDVVDAQVLDNCSTVNALTFVTDFFSDGDQPDAPNVTVTGNNASRVYPLGIHTITFTTADACGNLLSQELSISVFDFSPSVICNSVTLEIGENGLLAVPPSAILDDPDIISSLNLTIRFVNPSNFTQVIGDNLILSCNDLGVNQFAIETISPDGNSTICSNFINLVDPDTRCGPSPGKATLAGMVFSPRGEQMENINVNLVNSTITQTQTDQFGIYIFDNLPVGSACQISAAFDENAALGVTTFDMVLLQRHLLQLALFSNPYQYLAADVDMNGKVDIQDLLEIRSLILFQIQHFSASPSYRFIEADYQFENPKNPLLETISQEHQCNNIDDSVTDLNFISIKMGDIDGALAKVNFTETQERSATPYELSYDDVLVNAGQTVTVEILASPTADATALQFALSLTNASFQNIEASTSVQKNINSIDNTIHFAWTQFDDPLSSTLFSLTIKAEQTAQLSALLKLDSDYLAVQYGKQGIETKVSLRPKASAQSPAMNILGQNEPNPFFTETDITFFLGKSGAAKIAVRNLEGKTVHTHEANYAEGWHTYRFTHKNLPAGMYIYTLTQGQEIHLKKMIITK